MSSENRTKMPEIPYNNKRLNTEEADESLPLLAPSTQAALPSTELQGYLLMALSSIGFALMSAFVHISEYKRNFPVTSVLLIRGVVQMFFALLYIVLFLPFPRTFSNLSRQQIKLLALRAFTGSVGLAFYFVSLQKLPLGDAVTIFFCSPVITMILSSAFLGEPITFLDSIAGVICFAGVFMVARPGTDMSSAISPRDRIVGGLYSVISAVLFAICYVTVRRLGTSIHYMVSILSFALALTIQSTLIGVNMSPVEFWNTRREGFLPALIAALISFPSQCCINRAFQLCRAGPGSMIRNLDVPVSYVLGLSFLNESPSLLRLLGSMLVIFGTLLLGLRQLLLG